MAIIAILYVLPIAAVIHVYPGTPTVFKAFIDRGSYAVYTNSLYSHWLKMMDRYQYQDPVLLEDIGLPNTFGLSYDLIEAINFRVNTIPYIHDDEQYGPPEYFATPREMLENGQGDCEDYAILKMHLLLAAGFPPSDMYLLGGLYHYGDGEVGGHAVLAIIIDGEAWILDNMRHSIIPLSQYQQFEPMAAINWDGFKLLGALRY